MQVENYDQDFPELGQGDGANSPTSFKNGQEDGADGYKLDGEGPSDATRGDVDEPQDAEVANTGAATPMGYQGPLAPGNQQ